MSKYTIAVSCMSATYTVGTFEADNREDAITQARKQVMPDQRGWRFYEIDDD